MSKAQRHYDNAPKTKKFVFGPAQRVALFILAASLSSLHAASAPAPHWVATWGAAPVRILNSKDKVGTTTETYRQFCRISLGGSALRLVISNEFGIEPLTLSDAAVRVTGTNAPTPVVFNGSNTVVIPPGALVLSDPVNLVLPALSSLEIDLTVPKQPLTVLTGHPESLQVNLAGATPYKHIYFLKGIEVAAPAKAATIVAFGDSITDGHKSTEGGNHRWPDVLAERLQANPRTKGFAVMNEGISGNRLLRDLGGTNALARFDRDVLGISGVRYLILLEGINDIGHVNRPAFPGDRVNAEDLEFALSQLIERAHSHGIKVICATLLPYPGKAPNADAMVALQRAENDWIRRNPRIDAVIDFYAITHDPNHPDTLLPADDSGDHLHPGDAGYKTMGDGIDLRIFKSH